MPVRRWAVATSLATGLLALIWGAATMAGAPPRDRTISFYNIHSKETLTIQYMKGGKHIPQAMEQINWILRDWRRDEKTSMDPDLIDLVWEIHNELGSAEPIHIICGYRTRATNEMLRRTVGGQASESRHILGKAMDVYFPDVPVRKLRYSALIRERGGVGYYPTSAIPFVHIDTDRVRAWPRLPRNELALLFPSGHSQHLPDDGEPISKEDVRRALAGKSDLVQRLADFHEERARPKAPLQVAALTPLPQLLAAPRPIERPAARGTNPTDRERAMLAELASDAPRLIKLPMPATRHRPAEAVAGSNAAPLLAVLEAPEAGPTRREVTAIASAPAYDEEHPEELSYHPFPIAPLLTATVSADSPGLSRLLPPDLAKALETIDQRSAPPPAGLRLSLWAAQLLWSQQLRGEGVELAAAAGIVASDAEASRLRRRVAVEPQ